MIVIFFLILRLFFKSSFRSTAELSRKCRDFAYTSCPRRHTDSLTTNNPRQSGTFVAINEATMTHHYLPKSVVLLGFTLGVHSMDLDRHMTGIHHYSII